jgi:hypothetical protein
MELGAQAEIKGPDPALEMVARGSDVCKQRRSSPASAI